MDIDFVEYPRLKVQPQVFVRRTLPSAEFLDLLSQSIELQDKLSGKLFAPNTFAPAYTSRAKAGVTSVTALVFDIERKPAGVAQAEIEALVNRLDASGWEYLLCSSHSHRSDNCRFRLVLTLTRPLTPTEFAEARRRTNKKLHLEGLADPAAEDISRLSFYPSHAPGQIPVLYRSSSKTPLDPDKLLDGHIPVPFVATTKVVPEGWVYVPPEPPVRPFKLKPHVALLRKYRAPDGDTRKENLVKRVVAGDRLADSNFNSTLWSAVNILTFNLPAGTSSEEIMELLRPTLEATYGSGEGPISFEKAREVAQAQVERAIESRAESDAAYAEFLEAQKRKVETTQKAMEAGEEAELPAFVYCIPKESFYYSIPGLGFQLKSPVAKEGIIAHLQACGWDDEQIGVAVHGGLRTNVYGIEFVPGRPALFSRDGCGYLNAWSRPTLVPAPGDWSSIDRVLDSLTLNEAVDPITGAYQIRPDPQGKAWLVNWLAYAVQNPAAVPGTAVILNGGATGTGKNTLAYVMFQILGEGNTRKVTTKNLESRFTSSWIGKCLVFGDEIYNREHFADITDTLKDLVTGQTVSNEGKGVDEYEVQNRAKYILASNHAVPIRIEQNDRRFSVFTRHEPVTTQYKEATQRLFDANNKATPEFLKEIAAFAQYLLEFPVDTVQVRTVYDNASRRAVIEASAPPHLSFCKYVDEFGVDGLIADVVRSELGFIGSDFKKKSAEVMGGHYDFGDRGVSTQALYQCYRLFAKRSGTNYPVTSSRFGVMLSEHRPKWNQVRLTAPDGARIYCYVVARTQPVEVAGVVVPVIQKGGHA
jgi:hypothetical protein